MKIVIRKGTHTPLKFPRVWIDRKEWSFDVRLGESILTGQHYDHVSKICGVGFFPHHQKNSWRLGFIDHGRKSSVELVEYYYNQGERKTNSLGFYELPCHLNVAVACYKGGGLLVSVVANDLPVLMACKSKIKTSCISYMLFPFFGGVPTAPKDMTFMVSSKGE